MSGMNRRSSSGENSDDALEHCGLTATRRTWPAPNYELERKHTMMTSLDSSNEMHTSGGGLSTATRTTNTNSSTPQHNSTLTWVSPMTSDSLQQQHQQQEEFLQRKRQSSEMSIDLVWGEEEADEQEKEEKGEEGKKNSTPSTVLTARVPRPTGWSDSSSPVTVRRRLSMHEGSRRSGTLPASSAATVITTTTTTTNNNNNNNIRTGEELQEVTPTPLRRMPHLLQQPQLPMMEPATESRELPVRPGYTLPSPSTPLWPALEEVDDEEEEEEEEEENEDNNNNNNNNNNNIITEERLNTVESVREDVDMDADAVMRLTLSRRPSSFAQRVAPSSMSSVSISPPSVVVASSQEARRLFTTTNNNNNQLHRNAYNHNDVDEPANSQKSASGDIGVVHETVPMSQKSQRKAEETLRRIKADAWAEEMRKFFEKIDQRPLLAVTVDEQQS
ncbi:uncharacterized protein TM35_000751150 [Trypanosoma theileri]|uniref:Uncharacterized protein n=1 Tax=Trypanosoma theileri TaxID=67003 RepID=A0A1X0NFQ4_9TRYP|nr:uncharacterized protein TM35_000751150 [Trypanosoma theileri]ORC83348.1 hypothetical protein TM35_000751150 [Trypanosoma theileri]